MYSFCIILKEKYLIMIPTKNFLVMSTIYIIVHVYVIYFFFFSIKFVFPLNALAQNKTKPNIKQQVQHNCTKIYIYYIKIHSIVFPFLVTNHL